MSGEDFVSLLQRINYPKAANLDGSSFDWMFEKEATGPFLSWLCDEVSVNNILTEEELKQFNILENSGDGILDNKQLEEALHSLASLEENTLSEERLREEIPQLDFELQQSQTRKDVLIQHRNKLSLHHSSVMDKVYRLGSVENAAKIDYKQSVDGSYDDNTKLNECLEGMKGAVCSMSELYTTPVSSSLKQGRGHYNGSSHSERDNESGVFLSQLSLENYHEMEDKFTQELTAYTKKLFFEGISELAGEKEGTRYEFLEISKPETLLVRGETEEVNIEDCKELTRLQTNYPKSESAEINAKLQEKSLEAACSFTERKLHVLKDSPYPKEMKQLREKIQESENLLSVLHRDETMFSQQELPRLLQDSANCQLSQILRGDYNLKIARQDYFSSNQDEVIEELISQRSRNEFLTMAYEIEDRCHREIHRLLTALNMLLKKNAQAWQDRINLLKEPSLTPARHQRNTIDSRDKYLSRLDKALRTSEDEDKQSLFVTHNELTSQASALSHQVSSLTASLCAKNSNLDHRLSQLEKSVHVCESLVYKGSSTSSGQPALSPQPISDALLQLDSMLKKLEQAVLSVIKDVEHKKKILKTDPLQSIERELFVYYHTDQLHLRRVLDDMEARLNAQMVT